MYAEAVHVVSTLIDDFIARLDFVRFRPQIDEYAARFSRIT
jgi:hypothetical protein